MADSVSREGRVTALKVNGVGRDGGHPCFISVAFNREPTDNELRAAHDALRSFFAVSAREAVTARERMARLVDLTWGRAMEDGSVPSSKIVNELIEASAPQSEGSQAQVRAGDAAGRPSPSVPTAGDEELERVMEMLGRGPEHSVFFYHKDRQIILAALTRQQEEIELLRADLITGNSELLDSAEQEIASLKAEVERLEQSRHDNVWIMVERYADLHSTLAEREAEIERLIHMLAEVTSELEGEIEHRYDRVKDHAAMKPRYERDMSTVREARALLAAIAQRKEE
jgi:hypothetical protein